MNDRGTVLGRIVKVAFLAVWCVFTVFPLYWVTITAFKTRSEVFGSRVTYWPTTWTLDNFSRLMSTVDFGRMVTNSLLVAIVASIIVVAISIIAGYVLSRFEFPGRGGIVLAFLCTQMIPGFIALGPLYLMMSKFQLIDKLAGIIILYIAMLIPFSTIMLRGFFERIPAVLEEAAMIDGCGRLQAMIRIIVPAILPGVAATAIFDFVACWNELFLAVMMLNDPGRSTIPVGMNTFVGQFEIDWNLMAAGTVIAVLPTLVLFAFARRYIVSGLTAGAVKE